MSITLEQQERAQIVIANNMGIEKEKVVVTANLRDDLGVDSLDAIEITMALEDEFGIEISDESAEKIRTVQDVYDTVGALL